jgi:hypothetical protein
VTELGVLFGRKTVVAVAGLTFEAPPYAIHFELPFSDTSDANTGHVSIYNLSPETMQQLKKGTEVVVSAGYQDLHGIVFTGTIVTALPRVEDMDVITDITIGDGADVWLTARTNNTWKKETLVSTIVTDIITKDLKMTIGEVKPAFNWSYSRGKSFHCPSKNALEQLAKDSGSKLHILKRVVYFRPKEVGKETGLLLDQNSGLVGVPEPIAPKDPKAKVTYKVTALMNHMITTDAIIRITSKTTKDGYFLVKRGKYVSNDSDHYVEFEAVPV